MSKERDWRQYVGLIGAAIEATLPGECEIETLDAVKLLVRENNALRMALGIPTYTKMNSIEDKDLWADQLIETQST